MEKLMKIIQFTIIILWALWSYNTFSQELPKPVGYVNDFADVLTEGEERTLEAMLKTYEEKSTIEIAVVTIKSLNGIPVEQYTVQLAETWGVGKKNKDNGIVILNSIGDREWRVEVGYGLEEFITDGYAGNIGDNYLTPNLKNGNYFEAYKQTVEQIMFRLGNLTDADKERIKEEDDTSWPAWLIFLVIVIIIGFIILAVWADVSSGGGISGGGFFSGSSSGGSGFSGFGGGSFGGGGASGKY